MHKTNKKRDSLVEVALVLGEKKVLFFSLFFSQFDLRGFQGA
jgi:hypothetical protein